MKRKQIYFTLSQLSAITIEAEKSGISLSEMVRRIVDRDAEGLRTETAVSPSQVNA